MSMLALIKPEELFGEPVLSFEGNGNDLGWLSLSSSIEDKGRPHPVMIVPGCFNEQPADVGVSGFGDGSSKLT